MSRLLCRAAESGDLEKLKLRLEAGDDIESRDRGTGRTPLLSAVIEGHIDVVKLLLEKGADETACCKAVENDSLSWAIQQGHGDLVDLFLDRGTDPNRVPEKSFLGRTPLMTAAQMGFLDIAKRLLVAGAAPGLFDRQGNSALALAERAKEDEMVAFLRSVPGADPVPLPAPKTFPWPDIIWEEDAPIPDGATPAQIVRGYILAMYRWETSARQEVEKSRVNGGSFDFIPSLTKVAAVRGRYCTARKRVYERCNIGFPPEFDEHLTLLSEEYSNPSKCQILTRSPKDSPTRWDYMEMLFTLLRRQEQWRIDSVKRRLVGERTWDGVIL